MIDVQAGDLVICVDDSQPTHPYHVRRGHRVPVVKGRLYRIRELAPCETGEIGVRLVGIILPCYDRSRAEMVFNPARFRKVQKADDGFIQHMRMMRPKTPAHKREDA